MATTTFTVQGMTCEHCVRAVSEEVAAIDGVAAVDVDLASGAVVVTTDGEAVDPALVAAAVDEAGYDLAP